MVTTVLIVLLLIVLIFMAVRDGRGFFSDFLRVAALTLAICLFAAVVWPGLR